MGCGELRIETFGTRHHLFSSEQVQGAVEAHFGMSRIPSYCLTLADTLQYLIFSLFFAIIFLHRLYHRGVDYIAAQKSSRRIFGGCFYLGEEVGILGLISDLTIRQPPDLRG